jgi:WD40 repeat protein
MPASSDALPPLLPIICDAICLPSAPTRLQEESIAALCLCPNGRHRPQMACECVFRVVEYPDEKRIATCSEDGAVREYCAATGKGCTRLLPKGPVRYGRCVVFVTMPLGSDVLASVKASLILRTWDAYTGALLFILYQKVGREEDELMLAAIVLLRTGSSAYIGFSHRRGRNVRLSNNAILAHERQIWHTPACWKRLPTASDDTTAPVWCTKML